MQKKFTNLLILFSFLFVAVGPQNIHRLVHHFSGNLNSHLNSHVHSHTFHCFTSALAEVPDDENDFSLNPELKKDSCAFMQIASFIPSTITQSHIFDFGSLILSAAEPVAYKIKNQIYKTLIASTANPSTGPPQISY